MTEIIARREFSPYYIIFDIAFLIVFAALLLWKKKYMTVLVGFLAGLLSISAFLILYATPEAFPTVTACFGSCFGCR